MLRYLTILLLLFMQCKRMYFIGKISQKIKYGNSFSIIILKYQQKCKIDFAQSRASTVSAKTKPKKFQLQRNTRNTNSRRNTHASMFRSLVGRFQIILLVRVRIPFAHFYSTNISQSVFPSIYIVFVFLQKLMMPQMGRNRFYVFIDILKL